MANSQLGLAQNITQSSNVLLYSLSNYNTFHLCLWLQIGYSYRSKPPYGHLPLSIVYYLLSTRLCSSEYLCSRE
jgi:hypothetical protein